MVTLRKSNDRGEADFGWLQSKHSFSFGRYYDPRHMSFSDLRVINEDVVAPGAGFGTHPHEDMEILTYVLEGALAHVDSMGNRRVLNAGEFQRMTAGTGVTHSEMNASDSEPVHFLQIWVEPNEKGLEPGYEELSLDNVGDGLTQIAGPEGSDDRLTIHQDARIFVGKVKAGHAAALDIDPSRRVWLQMISGTAQVNGAEVADGDGLAITDQNALDMTAESDADFLVFDLR